MQEDINALIEQNLVINKFPFLGKSTNFSFN